MYYVVEIVVSWMAGKIPLSKQTAELVIMSLSQEDLP